MLAAFRAFAKSWVAAILIGLLIVAFAIFLVIKQVNRWFPPVTPPVTTRPCPLCLSAIPLGATRCAHCTAEVRPA